MVFRSSSNLLSQDDGGKGSHMTKSLYNGLGGKKKMTIAHAITSPSGARTKSQRETPYKHSVCSRQLEMCSVSHLLYLWCISSRALQ